MPCSAGNWTWQKMNLQLSRIMPSLDYLTFSHWCWSKMPWQKSNLLPSKVCMNWLNWICLTITLPSILCSLRLVRICVAGSSGQFTWTSHKQPLVSELLRNPVPVGEYAFFVPGLIWCWKNHCLSWPWCKRTVNYFWGWALTIAIRSDNWNPA